MEKRSTFIITGDTSSGKTAFLNDVFEFLMIFEDDIRGFLCKGFFNDEGFHESFLKFPYGNEELPFAAIKEKTGYQKKGKLFVNPEAVEKGKKEINDAIKSRSRIIFMDEVGELELDDQVWHDSLMNISGKFNGIHILSMKAELLDQFMEKYQIQDPFIKDVETASPRNTGESIMKLVLNM